MEYRDSVDSTSPFWVFSPSPSPLRATVWNATLMGLILTDQVRHNYVSILKSTVAEAEVPMDKSLTFQLETVQKCYIILCSMMLTFLNSIPMWLNGQERVYVGSRLLSGKNLDSKVNILNSIQEESWCTYNTSFKVNFPLSIHFSDYSQMTIL